MSPEKFIWSYPDKDPQLDEEINLRVKDDFNGIKIGDSTTVNLYQIPGQQKDSLQAYWSEFEFYERLDRDASMNPVFLQLFCTGTIIYTWPDCKTEKSWNFICFEHHMTIKDFLSFVEITPENTAILAAKVVNFVAKLTQMECYKLKPGTLNTDKIGVVLEYAPDSLTSIADIKLKLLKPSTVLETCADGQSAAYTSEEVQKVQKDLSVLLLAVCHVKADSVSWNGNNRSSVLKPSDELWPPGFCISEELKAHPVTTVSKDFIQLPEEFQGLAPAQWTKMAAPDNNLPSKVNNEGFFTITDVRYDKCLQTTLSESMKTLVLKSNEELANYSDVSCLKAESEFKRPNCALSPELQQRVDVPEETGFEVANKSRVVYPWLLYVAGCHLFNHYLGAKPEVDRKPEHLLAGCVCFSQARSECSRISKLSAFQAGSIARELEHLRKNVEEKHARASMMASTSLPNHQIPEWRVSEIKARIKRSPASAEQGGLVMADLALYFADTFWSEMGQLSAAEIQAYLQVLGGPYSDKARSLHAYLTSGR